MQAICTNYSFNALPTELQKLSNSITFRQIAPNKKRVTQFTLFCFPLYSAFSSSGATTVSCSLANLLPTLRSIEVKIISAT